MRVMLLHGWGGSDFPHWQSWLAGELAKKYGCVDFVRMPNFDFPVLDEWLQHVKNELAFFQPDIVVCHSLANTLWFHLCNENFLNRKIRKLYLVAPPSLNCRIEELSSFFPVDVPETLYTQKAFLIVSDNDPYLEMEEAKLLQHRLGIDMKVLHNAGHINAESGYGKWQWILENIQKTEK